MNFTKRGCALLAYEVLKSGIKAKDRIFFESGVFRFWMEFLDFGGKFKIQGALRPLAAKEGWKLPPYPMKGRKEAADGRA